MLLIISIIHFMSLSRGGSSVLDTHIREISSMVKRSYSSLFPFSEVDFSSCLRKKISLLQKPVLSVFLLRFICLFLLPWNHRNTRFPGYKGFIYYCFPCDSQFWTEKQASPSPWHLSMGRRK